MKQTDTIILYGKLSKVENIEGRELTYAIKRNLKNLQPDIDIFIEEEKEIQKLIKDFGEARTELQKKYATVDGKLKMKSEKEYDLSENKLAELNAEITKLADTEPHKESIKKYEEKWAELLEFRKQKESSFVPLMVKLSDIPQNVSKENMDLIFDIIE